MITFLLVVCCGTGHCLQTDSGLRFADNSNACVGELTNSMACIQLLLVTILVPSSLISCSQLGVMTECGSGDELLMACVWVSVVLLAERLSNSSSQQQQGEPFLVAVQAVPAQFFQEGFFDSW